MLIDNAIVVLENIDRHKNMGKSPFQAAYDGAREVWGAVLASTLTTVAVFLPVVFMEEEAGQLFRDIAIAVTCAVLLSLFVSVSVIPMLSRFLYRFFERRGGRKIKNPLNTVGAYIIDFVMWFVRLATRNAATRTLTILGLSAFSVLVAFLLFPKMEYLPQGNRNLIINLLIPPPGLSFEERKAIGEQVYQSVKPYVGKDVDGIPGVRTLFYVGSERIMLFGATSTQEQRAGEMIPRFRRMIFSIPGMYGVSIQAGIFQTRLGRGRSVEVDFSGEELNRIVQAAGMMYGAISEAIPGSQIRPIPSLELLFPEVRLIPLRDRLKSSALTARDFGIGVDVLMDGRKIGEFKPEGEKKLDLILRASEEDISTPEVLYDSLLALPGGKIVPISSLSLLERTTGITEIRHLERQRTITLQVTPPENIPLQQAMETITGLVAGMSKQDVFQGINIGQSGTADKLTETRQSLQFNFVLAAAIAYLLMAALFGNFVYPFIIMFTVPLAAAGGFVGLTLVNLLLTNQPLDILTMLGFVILVGVVVNNAILIVHQSLNNVRLHAMDHRQAVLNAVRTRLRPIYMSASTSIFGMLPLVLFPGPGSELYRGLGSVVLGGLFFSTIFTVFVIPSLLTFFIRMERGKPGPKVEIDRRQRKENQVEKEKATEAETPEQVN
jgi:HAE1 family hydrophobic/amphiphilic exporter-1